MMKRMLLSAMALYLLLVLLPLPSLWWKESGSDQQEKTPSAGTDGTTSLSEGTSSEEDVAVFRLYDEESASIQEVSERDFLIGTLSAEMPISYHLEALKAQAVAAYTYYSYQRQASREHPDEAIQGADFSSTPWGFPIYYSAEQLKEKWGDAFDSTYEKYAEAVDAVLGKRICYDGQPIMAVYHAISSGTTESAEVQWGTAYSYLASVPSPGDKLSPSYESTVTKTAEELSAALTAVNGELALEGDPAAWIPGAPSLSSAGTVLSLTVGNQSFTGNQLREALGLRSACFTVGYAEGTFTFTVHGYGHGVGMSQYGADYMARQGADYEEILKAYYTGVEIV